MGLIFTFPGPRALSQRAIVVPKEKPANERHANSNEYLNHRGGRRGSPALLRVKSEILSRPRRQIITASSSITDIINLAVSVEKLIFYRTLGQYLVSLFSILYYYL
jgi:hypothetical protein